MSIKMHMNHRLAFVAILLLAWPTLVLATPHEPKVSKKLKLGAIVSLTGDAARNGRNWLEGAQLAVDQLNQNGQQLELIIEDDATTPNKVASAFVKLATVDRVGGIIGGTWDFLAETAYPLAKQYRVPFITPSNPVEILSPAALSNPWIFTNGLSLGAEESVIRKFLKKRSIKSIGLAYINVPYGTSHADLVRRIAQQLNIPVLTDVQISYQGFHDGIKLAALKVSQKKPALVFIVLNYEGVDLMMRELGQVRYSPLVLMTHALKEAFDFGRVPDRYKHAFGIFPKFTSVTFEESFVKKFGRRPYDFAAAGYDATIFMTKVAARDSQVALEDLVLDYNGVTGEHRISSSNRSVVQAQAAIMSVYDGNLIEYILDP